MEPIVRAPQLTHCLHPEAMAYIVSQMTGDEKADFLAEFGEIQARHAATFESPQAPLETEDVVAFLADALALVRAWQVSLTLASDQEWNDQIAHSDKGLANGEVDDVVSASDLRSLLAVQ